jgi:hypothetical protein
MSEEGSISTTEISGTLSMSPLIFVLLSSTVSIKGATSTDEILVTLSVYGLFPLCTSYSSSRNFN